jgi:chemotaxis-related protein WspB
MTGVRALPAPVQTMLFLIFHLDQDRYALDAADVVEVLPFGPLKALPNTPAWVAGVFSYYGQPVPVIDLSSLALGRPAARRLSTRTVLVRYPLADAANGSRLLAIIVEQATRTMRRDPTDFTATGVATPQARYLGPVASDPAGLVQWISVQGLLPDDVRAILFVREAER